MRSRAGYKVWHYALFGFVFGLCFPVIAYVMTMSEQGMTFSLQNIGKLHQESNLFYIIALAPLVIGSLFMVIGKFLIQRLNYLVTINDLERDLRDENYNPVQKNSLRTIRSSYEKVFLFCGVMFIGGCAFLIYEFNSQREVALKIEELCRKVEGGLEKADVSAKFTNNAAFTQSKSEMLAIVQKQKGRPVVLIFVFSLALLIFLTILFFSHFYIFVPAFVTVQKGVNENTIAKRLIQNQSKELQKHSFASSHSNNAMAITDVVGNITWYNDGFQELNSFTEDIMDSHLCDILLTELSDEFIFSEIDSAILERKEYTSIAKFKCHDGGSFWSQFRLEPFHDEHGLHLGFFIIQDDITELIQAKDQKEEALKQIRMNLKTAEFIQNSLNNTVQEISLHFENTFIVNRPMQILSGDYMWFKEVSPSKFLFCLGDCVGHGVAGSLLATLYGSFLDEISKVEHSPDIILTKLNDKMKRQVKFGDANSEDFTCEAGVLLIDKNDWTIEFAGSNTELVVYDGNGEPEVYKSQRYGIASSHIQEEPVLQKIKMKHNSWLMMYSDGLKNMLNKDQERMKRKGSIDMLKTCHSEDGKAFENKVGEYVDKFLQDADRNDDILVCGLKIQLG